MAVVVVVCGVLVVLVCGEVSSLFTSVVSLAVLGEVVVCWGDDDDGRVEVCPPLPSCDFC